MYWEGIQQEPYRDITEFSVGEVWDVSQTTAAHDPAYLEANRRDQVPPIPLAEVGKWVEGELQHHYRLADHLADDEKLQAQQVREMLRILVQIRILAQIWIQELTPAIGAIEAIRESWSVAQVVALMVQTPEVGTLRGHTMVPSGMPEAGDCGVLPNKASAVRVIRTARDIYSRLTERCFGCSELAHECNCL
ncbi:hypothetical protein ACSNOI_29875 [Actinomadura kijaniata]|uniref:hypothetical protein n=1 Tax=Actinomadura kijaniata TaxID=46161 RepID=UPI003F1D9D0B